MARLRMFVVLSVLPASIQAQSDACPAPTLEPGGNVVETRFIPTPMGRAQEAVADAIQAAGAVLLVNGGRRVEGRRTKVWGFEITKTLPGDEAVVATLEPANQDGVNGARIRVETMRPDGKSGAPKRIWSRAIADEALCLARILSVADPRQASALSAGENASSTVREVIPAGTAVLIRSRRFVRSLELMPGERLVFELGEDVKVGGMTVLARGAFVSVRADGDPRKGARRILTIEFVQTPGGQKILLDGTITTKGRYQQGHWFVIRAGMDAQGVTRADTPIRVPSALR